MSPAARRRAPDSGFLSEIASIVRPTHLIASLVAVGVGGALALDDPGSARWPVWVAVALSASLFLAAARLLLAASGERALRRRSARRSQASASRAPRSPGVLAATALGCLIAGAALGFLAVIERGWPMFWLGVAAAVGSVAYALGPELRGRGVGEAAAFLLFGPLPVATGALAVTGKWSPLALGLSLPLGLLAAAVVLAGGIECALEEGRARWTTLAGMLRRPGADYLLLGLLLAAYASLLLGVLRGWLAPVSLLPWLTLPAALRSFSYLRAHADEGPGETSQVAERYAGLYVRFAALLAVGLAVTQLLSRRAT